MNQSYLERIRECKDLDSARRIISKFTDDLHGLQVDMGLQPNVGKKWQLPDGRVLCGSGPVLAVTAS